MFWLLSTQPQNQYDNSWSLLFVSESRKTRVVKASPQKSLGIQYFLLASKFPLTGKLLLLNDLRFSFIGFLGVLRLWPDGWPTQLFRYVNTNLLRVLSALVHTSYGTEPQYGFYILSHIQNKTLVMKWCSTRFQDNFYFHPAPCCLVLSEFGVWYSLSLVFGTLRVWCLVLSEFGVWYSLSLVFGDNESLRV